MAKAEARALLERAAKYLAKGLEMGAYAETAGGNLPAQRLLKLIRNHLAASRPLFADTVYLLDRATRYVAKGLEMGAYTNAEPFLGQLRDYVRELDDKQTLLVHHATLRSKKPPAQLQREIDAALGKQAQRGKARKLSSGNQRLLFITFEPAETFAGVRAVPLPVDFRESDVAHVWTLYNETDKNKPPALPFSPVHNRNAFIEDRLHDWNIVNGKFRYGSRVMDQDVWVLVEMKNGRSDRVRGGGTTVSRAPRGARTVSNVTIGVDARHHLPLRWAQSSVPLPATSALQRSKR